MPLGSTKNLLDDLQGILEKHSSEKYLNERRAFREYENLEDDRMVHFLSNALLNMDGVLYAIQEERCA